MRNAKSICNVLQCGILINFVPIRHIWFSKSSLKQADIFALLRATTLAAYIKFDFANFVVRLSIVYICFCAHNTFHASLRAMFHHHHRKCRASSSGVAGVTVLLSLPGSICFVCDCIVLPRKWSMNNPSNTSLTGASVCHLASSIYIYMWCD